MHAHTHTHYCIVYGYSNTVLSLFHAVYFR